jgi:hypothetical protein
MDDVFPHAPVDEGWRLRVLRSLGPEVAAGAGRRRSCPCHTEIREASILQRIEMDERGELAEQLPTRSDPSS